MRDWTLKETSVALAIFLQVAVLIWGAAQISSAVQQTNQTLERQRETMMRVDQRLNDHSIRISVLEAMAGYRSDQTPWGSGREQLDTPR